uniref:ADP-ribosylation factor-binding protein GGA1 isoform X1 n=1 Tax=Ciona intestinalis TaxID=7719 RepID=UPI000180CFAD|nr:ADP-ribosylation factor-binding protein GGA1 isoform X1 [Ciona intestinalis]|eukprot:XP_002122616.1 ADP-ribosylation factor-binding protein GGA1 isoform X1 [Ciona intestinalis]
MADDPNETLETLLNKATSTLNRQDDWEYIMAFCDKVNFEIEGAQNATRLIAHKIQSPQELEALRALTVLEACVKNCGEIFQKELGKYRFLNEMIKVVSPKYLGDKTSEKVQKRVLVMLYTWSIALTDQIKIRDAYQMLKKQGIVTTDPEYDQSMVTDIPAPKESRDTLFTDEEKRKQLDKLLKSTRPEDLQAANRLIKSVVKEDEDRMEKMKKRNETLEEVTNNIRLLNEMLTHFDPDVTAISDMQMMKELYDSCHKLRPTLFRLASDTDDDEGALMEILRANDDVTRVMQSFEKIVSPKLTSVTDRKADGAAEPDKPQPEVEKEISSTLLDLANLNFTPTTSSNDLPATGSTYSSMLLTPPPNSLQSNNETSMDNMLLDFQSAPTSTSSAPPPTTNDVNSLFSLNDLLPSNPPPQPPTLAPVNPTPMIPKLTAPPQPQQKPSAFSDIDALSRGLMEQTLGHKLQSQFPKPAAKPTLHQLSQKPVADVPSLFDIPQSQPPQPTTIAPLLPLNPPPTSLPTSEPLIASSNPPPTVMPTQPPQTQDMSLADVFVALESIRPSTFAPLTVYDKNGIRVMLHFAKDHASPVRTDTLVAVVSIMSTRTNPVENIVFQAAVPKVMRIKLQPPSNTDLAAFNPILSSPPITQVMIIANPAHKDVKVRFKLDYKIDDQTSIFETGEINNFPPADQWGKL